MASIGAVVVIGCFVIAVGALWLAYQVRKCERNEAQKRAEERERMQTDLAEAKKNADAAAATLALLESKRLGARLRRLFGGKTDRIFKA